MAASETPQACEQREAEQRQRTDDKSEREGPEPAAPRRLRGSGFGHRGRDQRVFALDHAARHITYTVGHLGLGVLLPLLKVIGTMYAALFFFIFVVLLPIALSLRIPLRGFLRAITEPVTLAFATASSEAALPRAMEEMEAFGVLRETVAFVFPTGYSFNLAGSSLYQSIALLFIAQAAGIHLSLGQQTVMLLTLLISSKGTAGVARASLVIVLAAATSYHFPLEPVFLLFGIDQLMDMGRTAVNVLGNCLACVVIARWEGEFPAPFGQGEAELQLSAPQK